MLTGEQLDCQQQKVVFGTWEADAPKGQIYLVHGFAEHYRRYDRFARQLNKAGYTVHGFDLPGHGLSAGVRGHIDQFDQYIKTLDWFITNNPNHLNDTPTFLFGHSMGGLIASHYCINQPNQFKGLILTSPLAGFGGMFSLIGKGISKLVGRNDPSRSVPKALDPKGLTSIKTKWPEYTSDPLRLNTISPSLFQGMLRWSELLLHNAKLLKLPLLVFYSRTDTVVSPEKVASFFRNSGPKDKQLIAFTDTGHEIIHDHTEEQMVQKSLAWLKEHR